MKILVAALAALLVAVLAAYGIGQLPGTVTFLAGGRIVRVSLAFVIVAGLVASVLAWFLVRLLYRTLTLRRRLTRWRAERRRRRAERTLHQGLLALAAGRHREAEKLLVKSGGTGIAPAIPYLAAAEAAEAQNAPERRDRFLALAALEAPDAELAATLRRAEFELANRRYGEARAALESLADRHPGNARVLALQLRLYDTTGDWPALAKLLPVLKRFKALPADALQLLDRRTAEALLAGPVGTREALDALWRELPKAARADHRVRVAYCARLYGQGRTEEAERLLAKLLDESWEAGLVRLYGEHPGGDPAARLARAERWLAGREDDPELLLALGRLSIASRLWGKARDYLEAGLGIRPEPLACELLAQAYEGLGEAAKAAQCRRRGLGIALQAPDGPPALAAPGG
ncbi:MAG: hypothetical protein HY943_09625 [Gammaproteobacteria bacterium]|nr:hypothetical protein [Gammaproteobacteria bacterium]